MKTRSHRERAEALVQALGYPDDDRVRAIFLVGSSASGEEDAYSDVDVMIAINTVITDEERLRQLRALGCRNIMLAIAGMDNPALPVQSQVIDKFVYQDTWFDVSYHLPHQLAFDFDCVPLFDKDGITPEVCDPQPVTHRDEELKARAQADLRLLHVRIHRYEKYARRQEWVGLDLSAIKNSIVDTLMVLNDQPSYNRYSSRIGRLLRDLPLQPERLEERLLDILHLDDREAWSQKLEMLHQLETDLTALCEARWGPIPMFDDEDADSEETI